METITYRKELEEKLRKNPISKEDAGKTINWAFSGNQECYSLAERDTGYSIRELISIANGEVTYKEPDVEVISESRSSVPTTQDPDVVIISDTESEHTPDNPNMCIVEIDGQQAENFPLGIRRHGRS